MAHDPDPADYATITLTHHAMTRERRETLAGRRGRKTAQPECMVIGHAWTEDPNREGGTICLVCQVVRFP